MAANEVLNSVDLTKRSQISYVVRITDTGTSKILDLTQTDRAVTPVYS